MSKGGLGYQLRVPRHVLSKIKKEHSTADWTTETVEYWRSVDPNPSWRRLMEALQCSTEHRAVKNVMPYVEALTGECFVILIIYNRDTF